MTEAQRRDVPIFDADQHMYETPEALTRYLPERYRYAVQYAQMGRQTRLVINNKVSDFIPNPTFERVAAPRRAREILRRREQRRPDAARNARPPAIEAPAATKNPADRIAELDRQGVVEALNYPTLASLVEHSSADDPELTLAIIHALNQWMAEHWSYVYDDRLFSTPRSSTCPKSAARKPNSSTCSPPAPRWR